MALGLKGQEKSKSKKRRCYGWGVAKPRLRQADKEKLTNGGLRHQPGEETSPARNFKLPLAWGGFRPRGEWG